MARLSPSGAPPAPSQNTTAWSKPILLIAILAITTTAHAQLTGTKNVPGDFPSLASAISNLNTQGVGTGGVVINLLPGNAQTAPAGGYVVGGAGSLVLTTASSGNTISVVGNGNTITAPNNHVVGSLTDGIFKLIGADWVTISGFNMLENAANTTTTAASNNMTEWGVALLYVTTTDGAQNNTIQNNTIDLDRSYQNTFGIYSNSTHAAASVNVSATATGATGGNNNLRVYGNTIADVNQGIVHVGPTAAADHNNTADIGGTTALQGNTITNFGRTGTFSSFVNVSGSVNGILVRNTRNFNISWNTITSQNSGPLLGTLNGIQIPDASNPVIGTLTQTINNNSLSLQKGSTSGINGITMTGAGSGNSVNSTTTCNMNGNNFHTFGHTVSTSSDIYFMNQSGNPLVQTFNNNTFSNISVNTTGEVLFFRYVNNMLPGASLSISNNAIVGGFTRTGVGTTTVWAVSSTSSVNGTTHTITGNNFSNISLAGASEFTGFRDWDGNASGGPTKTITGNTFSNITTGAQLVTPLSVDFAGPSSTVSNNTISGITTTLTTGVSAMLFLGSGNKTGLTCSSNVIGGVSAASPFLYGIQNAASNVTIAKNRIHGLSTSSTTFSGWVTAIQVQTTTASSTVTVANNLVGNLNAPASTNPNGVIGINMSGNAASSSFRVYYNSIFLNATTSGAGFGSSGIQAAGSSTVTTSVLDMRNNVVVNTSIQNGAGLTVAYRRTTGTAGTLANYAANSNNNLFYAGSPSATNLIYADGTSIAQSLLDYQNGVFAAGSIGPRDAASVTALPSFLSTVGANPDFLHIDPSVPTPIESGASPIGGFTDDFDGDVRNGTTPDIGADEFNGIPQGGCSTPPNAGVDGTLNVCENRTTNSLFAQLSGSPDAGGTWTGPSAVTGDNYDAAVMIPGEYIYTVTAPSCPTDEATVTVSESAASSWYADTDGDGYGSGASTGTACTAPNSGDVTNNTDNCPNSSNPDQLDGDGDGTGDECDACPADPLKTNPGTCGCGVAETDTDGDGTADCVDPCPLLPGLVIGDPCDDGDPATYNDIVQAGCACSGEPAIVLSARACLEGPYDPSTGLMNDALRSLGTFPLEDPYPGLGYSHTGAGGGSLLPAVLATSGNDAIVDWVVIELRSDAQPAVVLASRSVLLQRDAEIVDPDGISPVAFAIAPGSYHVAIRHRNHLGAMTTAAIALSPVTTSVDFSTNATITYGSDARKSLSGAFPAMVLWSGDVGFNGDILYTGSGNDRDPVLIAVGSTTPNNVLTGAYSTRDVNMNGEVKYTGIGNDRDPILINVGSTTPNSVRIQQLP